MPSTLQQPTTALAQMQKTTDQLSQARGDRVTFRILPSLLAAPPEDAEQLAGDRLTSRFKL